jgi:hypothetical protein
MIEVFTCIYNLVPWSKMGKNGRQSPFNEIWGGKSLDSWLFYDLIFCTYNTVAFRVLLVAYFDIKMLIFSLCTSSCPISGPCNAGCWCKNGSAVIAPTDGVTGGPCPAGKYCPQGTKVPEPCPVGTMSNSTGLSTPAECPPCPAGYYCDVTGIFEPVGPCAPGYYCTGNTTSATPNDGGVTGAPCTIGHYCPGQTANPVPCPVGTFMKKTQASVCDACTPGHYCLDGLNLIQCPAGFYCPSGTGNVWKSCPYGTYSTNPGLASASQCTRCSGGYYCNQYNASQATGPCAAGYYCTDGSDTPTPDLNATGNAGPCPAGYYCPEQTTTPQPCPIGTYSNETKLVSSTECTLCSYGQYCGTPGLSTPTGPCAGGFYCLLGAKVANNPVSGSMGGPCPLGFKCPPGTSFPISCPAGTYNAFAGQQSCTPCPANYYCPVNSTNAKDFPCPVGHYCPAGTVYPTEHPCEKGTYNKVTGKGRKSDCTPCDPGKYCATSGLSKPTGQCTEGWYCIRGAWADQPADFGTPNCDNSTVNISSNCYCPTNATGGQCQKGQYCPMGSNEALSCTAGKKIS